MGDASLHGSQIGFDYILWCCV